MRFPIERSCPAIICEPTSTGSRSGNLPAREKRNICGDFSETYATARVQEGVPIVKRGRTRGPRCPADLCCCPQVLVWYLPFGLCAMERRFQDRVWVLGVRTNAHEEIVAPEHGGLRSGDGRRELPPYWPKSESYSAAANLRENNRSLYHSRIGIIHGYVESADWPVSRSRAFEHRSTNEGIGAFHGTVANCCPIST